jgi:hypothetical protein
LGNVSGTHRELKIRRLREAIERIPAFIRREPLIEDTEFDSWNRGVLQILSEIFEARPFGYAENFKRISCRAIHVGGGYRQRRSFKSDYLEVWNRGLREKENILREALEEAETVVEPPVPVSQRPLTAPLPPAPHYTINVNQTSQNVASATNQTEVSMTIELGRLFDDLQIPAERRHELEGPIREAEGSLRKCVDAVKKIGGVAVKDVALPLLVEFIKKQSGIGP